MFVNVILQNIRESIEDLSPNIYRASLLGKCPRRLVFQKFSFPGRISTRGKLVLIEGEEIHKRIKSYIKQLFYAGFLPEIEKIEIEDEYKDNPEKWEIEIKISDNLTIIGHPDIKVWHKIYGPGVIEIKSASNYAFLRALKLEIDEDYLAQLGAYIYSGQFDWGGFIFYRKETSHLLEILFFRESYNVEYRLMEHNEKEFFIIETPFNYDFSKIIEKYKIIEQIQDPMKALEIFSEPVNHYVCQNCNGLGISGKVRIQTCRRCSGTGLEPSPVYLKYPCSYCPYIDICYPGAILEFDENLKPKWRIK